MATRAPRPRPTGISADHSADHAAVDRFCAASPAWDTRRVLDEGLDLARDAAWADHAVLVSIDGTAIRELARRPVADETTMGPRTLDPDWFPWGLAPVNPRRFLLVGDARGLSAAPGSSATLGDLGIRSCLHLPVQERQRSVGALQLAWSTPHPDWDDRRGRLLRILSRLLLSRAAP